MKAWTRVPGPAPMKCGGCGRDLAKGQPLQIWTLPGVARQRRRCVMCAETLPPADLPPLEAMTPVLDPIAEFESVRHILPRALPFDAKTRQVWSD